MKKALGRVVAFFRRVCDRLLAEMLVDDAGYVIADGEIERRDAELVLLQLVGAAIEEQGGDGCVTLQSGVLQRSLTRVATGLVEDRATDHV